MSSIRRIVVEAVAPAAVVLQGCIFTISPDPATEGDPETETTDVSADGRDVTDADDVDELEDTRDAPTELDAAPDGATDGTGDTADVDDAGAETDVVDAAQTGPNGCTTLPRRDDAQSGAHPLLLYVTDQENLGYITRNSGELQRHTVELEGEGSIWALGPSIQFDDDGRLEVPLVRDDGSDAPALYVAELDGRMSDPIVDETLVFEMGGRLGIGDFDDDCNPDIFYADGQEQIARVDDDIQSNRQEGLADPLGDQGPIQQPQAVVGAYDRDGDDREAIYWADVDLAVEFVEQKNAGTTKKKFESTGLGANNNIGIGPPAPLEPMDGSFWPGVDSSGNVKIHDWTWEGLEPATEAAAKKTPLTFANLVASSENDFLELVFIGTSGLVKYVDFRSRTDNYSVEPLVVGGNQSKNVSAHARVGLVKGRSDFYRRMRND